MARRSFSRGTCDARAFALSAWRCGSSRYRFAQFFNWSPRPIVGSLPDRTSCVRSDRPLARHRRSVTARSTGSPPDSNTETYAALKLEIDNWRWAGVLFFIRTGKQLADNRTEVRLVFKHPPRLGFLPATSRRSKPSQIVRPDRCEFSSPCSTPLPGPLREGHLGAEGGREAPQRARRPARPLGRRAEGLRLAPGSGCRRAVSDTHEPDGYHLPYMSDDWLVDRVLRLGRETVTTIGESRLVEETSTTIVHAGYPSLGPAAFLAWAALEDDNVADSELAARITAQFIADTPVLRLRRRAYRLATRMPDRLQPRWVPQHAISAGATLGWIILALEGRMSAPALRRMRQCLARCYDDLQRMSLLDFYINGNYEIPLCELVYLHAHINGSEGGHEEYERCLDFLCHPDRMSPRWRGHGLHIVRDPSEPDWHDAVGYFSEVEEVNRPEDGTFDGEYTQLQLDYLIRLWLLNGDDRILKFSNALINAILPLTDETTWQIDTRNGSRRNNINPFWNAGVAVLALHGGRSDFPIEKMHSQFTAAIDDEYRRRAEEDPINPYVLRGYGLTLLSILVGSSPRLFDRARIPALRPSPSS